jgi:hypothetical protein
MCLRPGVCLSQCNRRCHSRCRSLHGVRGARALPQASRLGRPPEPGIALLWLARVQATAAGNAPGVRRARPAPARSVARGRGVSRHNGPEMVVVFLSPPDVQIIDTWYVNGLRATGTQDLYVDQVFVPDEMTGGFSMPDGPRPVRECVLTRLARWDCPGAAGVPPTRTPRH